MYEWMGERERKEQEEGWLWGKVCKQSKEKKEREKERSKKEPEGEKKGAAPRERTCRKDV